MNLFTKKEKELFGKINTPAKIQDYLNSLPFNFERDGEDTLKSPIRTLRERNAHCFEGALLGAYMLSLCGYQPLVLHLEATKDDFDHCVVPFKQNGLWGALSKTNHAVLRYREPVYQSIRELVMSYFHEYFTNDGKKNLRKYSEPLNLNKFNKKSWWQDEEDLWYIDKALDRTKHHAIAPKKVFRRSRRADDIEIKAGKIEEFKSKENSK